MTNFFLMTILFFSVYVQTSDTKKREANNNYLPENQKLKKLKQQSFSSSHAAGQQIAFNTDITAPVIPSSKTLICGLTKAEIQLQALPQQKKKPGKFHFRDWKESGPVLSQSVKVSKAEVPTVSIALSRVNLQQMRKKMSSISHCLKGNALLLRTSSLKEEDLEQIVSVEVKELLREMVEMRLYCSSSTKDDLTGATDKSIRRRLNFHSLSYRKLLPIIAQEPQSLEIIACIEGDLKSLGGDCVERMSFKNQYISETKTIDNKTLKVHLAVENADTMINVISHYYTLNSTQFIGYQTQDAQSRNLFNQLESLQQTLICDDYVTKLSLELRYLSILKLYESIKPRLSEQVKMYAQPSFVAIKKAIDEFEEN